MRVTKMAKTISISFFKLQVTMFVAMILDIYQNTMTWKHNVQCMNVQNAWLCTGPFTFTSKLRLRQLASLLHPVSIAHQMMGSFHLTSTDATHGDGGGVAIHSHCQHQQKSCTWWAGSWVRLEIHGQQPGQHQCFHGLQSSHLLGSGCDCQNESKLSLCIALTTSWTWKFSHHCTLWLSYSTISHVDQRRQCIYPVFLHG